MIDPAKLTEDQGFVDGVVVEIADADDNKHYGKLFNVTEHSVYTVEDSLRGFAFGEVLSIRPLTGPMAIWNFAPEWATHCLQMTDDQGNIWGVSWYRDLVLDPLIPDDPDEIITNRPFWARSEK